MGISIEKIISTGGGAKSPFRCQIKADITGTIIEVPEYNKTSLHGAAILAAVRMGEFKSIEEACKRFIIQIVKTNIFMIRDMKNIKVYTNTLRVYFKEFFNDR